MNCLDKGYHLTLRRYAAINPLSSEIYDTFFTLEEANEFIRKCIASGQPSYRYYVGHLSGTISVTVYLENSSKYRVVENNIQFPTVL